MSNSPPSDAPKDIAVRKGAVVGKAGPRDPRSVYGGAVVGLITLFFRKYLARDAVAGVARKEARCLSLA